MEEALSTMNSIEARFHLPFDDFTLETDLQLPAKGVSALFGHSGSGKTTLLRCIAGLENAQQGFLKVGDTVWQDSDNHIFLPTYQRPLGYVFQEASLFPHLNVRKNLEYGRKRVPKFQQHISFEQTMDLLGIEHLLERMPERLSGGEKQRVAIARALLLSPQVLLMDEPLAALDQRRKQEILPFLTRLHNELEIPVIYVTHSIEEVTQLADYLVIMEAGKVLANGVLEETFTKLDSPLARDREASTVLQVTVCGYEAEYHLMQVKFAGGLLSLPYQQDMPIDTPIRLRVYAKDISLSLQKPEQVSILNILPARITGVTHGKEGQTLVRLNLNGVPMLAHITRKSAIELALEAGMQVYAQIKATAVAG